MKKSLLVALALGISGFSFAQSLYVPGGTGGIGASTNGNVGIGTLSPYHKLEITDNSGTPSLGLRGNLNSKIVFEPNDGSDRFSISADMDISAYKDLLKLGSYYYPSALVIRGDGNIGIGTNNPVALLSLSGTHQTTQARLTLPAASNVGGSGDVHLQLWVSEPGITWEGGGIGTNVTNNGAAPAGFGRINPALGQSYIRFITNGGAMALNTTNNAGTHFQTMYLKDGNVGIGTANPGNYKLNVWGPVRAHEVVVNTTGADFVFEDRYRLRPLAEVEQFIRENKHLPEIPPAAKMQEEGVGLAELQTKLLQKIEELTLYVIELKKNDEALTKDNDDLKKSNERLKTAIEALQRK